MSLTSVIAELGGLAATHELYARGFTRWTLGRAVASGHIVRVRQGWYCAPTLPLELQRAARVGGPATCVTGARVHGLAVFNDHRPHSAIRQHSSRLRSAHNRRVRLGSMRAADAVAHWNLGTDERVLLDVRSCLVQMAMCQSPERVVAAADSALRLRTITLSEWRDATAALPRRLRLLLDRVDPASESITESLFRFRMERIGLGMRSQVAVAGVGVVDFVIGTRLVIEIDGYAYHSDPDAFEKDRRRDARLSARGYRVLRFSYKQVTSHWSEVKAAVLASIARGDHL